MTALPPPKTLDLRILEVPIKIPVATPYKFVYATAALLAFMLLLCFTASQAASEMEHAFKTIGRDCAPSIVAAQQVRMELADLDCNTINTFIATPDSKEMKEALDTIDTRNAEIAATLVTAAENIAFGDTERKPITTMVQDAGLYQGLMTEARIYNQEFKDNVHDFPVAVEKKEASVSKAKEGTKLLHEVMLPAADALDKANTDIFELTYRAHQSNPNKLIFLFAAFIALAAVVLFQVYLVQKTRRIFNLPIAAATFMALIYTIGYAGLLYQKEAVLHSAVYDAFASIHALWHARAIACDCNGEESRWLFDPGGRTAYASSFYDKVNQIVQLDSRQDQKKQVWAILVNPKTAKGYLPDELNNITFQGELEAASDTTRYFADYLDIDAQIRRLGNEVSEEDAIALCLSTSPPSSVFPNGGSDYVFDQFDDALRKTIDINQAQFDSKITDGINAFAGFQWIHCAAALLLCALIAAGIWPRIQEYHR
jgi:hypothetical protein